MKLKKITKEQLSRLFEDNFDEITIDQWCCHNDTHGKGYGRAFYGTGHIYFRPKPPSEIIKFIPYREIDNPDEDSFNAIYEFLIQGTEKYSVLISIDDFNHEGKQTNGSCTCPDFSIRKNFPETCKHIDFCVEILKKDGKIQEDRSIPTRD